MPTRPAQVMPLLGPVSGTGLVDSVARRIEEAVRVGLVAPGDQLPSEGVLAGHLGVSTVTLREALASLREQGLVETRRGRNGGSFIRERGAPPAAELAGRLAAMSATELRDLGDECFAVGGACAWLAARRSATDNVRRLRGFAAELAAGPGRAERSRAHSRFWIELALAGQSERLTRASVRLQSAVSELLWLPARPPLDAAEVAAALSRLVDAVEAEDEAAARRRAEAEVERSTRWLVATHLRLTRRR